MSNNNGRDHSILTYRLMSIKQKTAFWVGSLIWITSSVTLALAAVYALSVLISFSFSKSTPLGIAIIAALGWVLGLRIIRSSGIFDA